MPADFRINLAKDMTSTEEERTRFYNRMLLYLVSCSTLLVLAAYLTSMNVSVYLANKSEQHRLMADAAVVGVGKEAFKNPKETYAGLDTYALRVASLKRILGRQVKLLPVVSNLFLELPENVALQSLSADTKKISFGLVMPHSSDDAGDPVKELGDFWEANEELMKRVATIRPLTGERRTVGKESMFHLQFECILKK